ncbi:discoidin domain-containing protein [Actinokineospora cianjurensis]|uniref:F5/8 type C domain-containing protein n=1 Tax=Actinokineospora cianjurensis TaxID=585224 RepID=A0A421B3C0_9PSEU|nr:discoidin domain-containing protein [Actinokineospora cianjurensis]RLK58867.1 F5/8 type C domain-containing protein [Actinokineospora cianjurensis]
MRLLDRRHLLPAALALAGVSVLGVLVPTAMAAPQAGSGGSGAAVATTVTTTPPSSPPTMPTWDPCYQGPPSSPPSGTTYLATPTPTSTTQPSSTMPPLPTTPRPPLPGENFALSGVARASSTLTNYYTPAKVNDGNTGTASNCQYAWVSANRSIDNPEWVSVTWPDLRSVGHVVVYNSLLLETRDFDIQVLNESGKWWDTVATYNNNTNTVVRSWFGARNTRAVRVLVKVGSTSAPGIARVNEIQAFAY